MMLFKFPKDSQEISWTQHIKNKMLFYRLSEQKIKQILRNPHRREEGIAPNTIAAMQINKLKKQPEEAWIMYQIKNQKSAKTKKQESNRAKIAMISAWRYPGISKPGNPIPIPEDIMNELNFNSH